MKFNVKAVMLDLDGTLIHTAPEIAMAANEMLAALEKPILPESQIQGFIGEGALTLIKRCLSHTLNNEPDQALLAQAQPLFFTAYAKYVAKSQPYPSVLESLRAIKSTGAKLACITNKPAAFTLPLLAESGLSGYFDLVVSGDTLSKKKPDPEQIFHICQQLNVPVAQSVLIGDSKTDIEAARNAGCYVFTVPYGYNQGYKMDGHADAQLNTIRDAVALIAVDHTASDLLN
jgi:phosphoglycolate phosphatase